MRHKHHIYVHIQCFKQQKKKNKHIPVKYDLPLIIFKKLMSAYVLYKIDFFLKQYLGSANLSFFQIQAG